jgi:hypothetical protein
MIKQQARNVMAMRKFDPPLPGLVNFGALQRDRTLSWPPTSDQVHIDGDLLRSLLRLALEHVRVDESYYLRMYPDVVEALDKRLFMSPHHHYVTFGYFEDRLPYRIEVDEDFYFLSNPDIKAAVEAGLIPSAQAHFERHGYKEGRLPAENWSLLAD